MSLFTDLMDGVPVKISEKYKPPPRVEIGRRVVESEARARHIVDVVGYDFGFERRVLNKTSELRSVRESSRNERRHRLRLYDEAKQRRLDEVAAAEEAAERLRQLSISHVSYPSADQIIDICPPDTDYSPLLHPVRLPQPSLTHPLDSDPLDDIRSTMPRPVPMQNHNLAHLTVLDFDHNSASPFDELELKSINDIEQLKQVLQDENEQPGPESNVCDSYLQFNAGAEHSVYHCYPLPAPVTNSYVPTSVPQMRMNARNETVIFQELLQEISSQQLKYKAAVALANTSPSTPFYSVPTMTNAEIQESKVKKPEALPDPYNELPPRLQELCRTVEGMGFPRERVARIVTLIGDSDKKVVEVLISIGQLLDLGFSESHVSAALAKHNFNRDKALDELIA